jgi:hypothetical protein
LGLSLKHFAFENRSILGDFTPNIFGPHNEIRLTGQIWQCHR